MNGTLWAPDGIDTDLITKQPP